MNKTWLALLQAFLLVNDGLGVALSFQVAQHYNPKLPWRELLREIFEVKKRGPQTPASRPILRLYIFFGMLTWVFFFLTISDLLVIIRVSDFWATLPIVRGLTFRLPIALAEMWMIYRACNKT